VQAPVGLVFHRAASTSRDVHEALIVASAGKEQRAVEMLTPHAESGDILAQFYLGVLNLRARKPAVAARWFERSAEQEHGPSQMALASAYRKGQGVTRDPARAMRWLVRAARNRDATARRHLAQVEAAESGSTGDWRKANYHLYLSAEQGLAAAQRDNGVAFIAGTGREKDMATGLFWLAAAGMAQDAKAVELFEQYDKPISDSERQAIAQRARDFWEQPQPSDHVATLTYDASAGDSRARYELGLLTMTGIEIEPDKEAGLLLIALSAATGDVRAVRTFANFEKTESSELIAQIRRSADALTHSPTQ